MVAPQGRQVAHRLFGMQSWHITPFSMQSRHIIPRWSVRCKSFECTNSSIDCMRSWTIVAWIISEMVMGDGGGVIIVDRWWIVSFILPYCNGQEVCNVSFESGRHPDSQLACMQRRQSWQEGIATASDWSNRYAISHQLVHAVLYLLVTKQRVHAAKIGLTCCDLWPFPII